MRIDLQGVPCKKGLGLQCRQMPSSNLNSNFLSETKIDEKWFPLFVIFSLRKFYWCDVFLNKHCKNIAWLCIMKDELAIRKYI